MDTGSVVKADNVYALNSLLDLVGTEDVETVFQEIEQSEAPLLAVFCRDQVTKADLTRAWVIALSEEGCELVIDWMLACIVAEDPLAPDVTNKTIFRAAVNHGHEAVAVAGIKGDDTLEREMFDVIVDVDTRITPYKIREPKTVALFAAEHGLMDLLAAARNANPGVIGFIELIQSAERGDNPEMVRMLLHSSRIDDVDWGTKGVDEVLAKVLSEVIVCADSKVIVDLLLEYHPGLIGSRWFDDCLSAAISTEMVEHLISLGCRPGDSACFRARTVPALHALIKAGANPGFVEYYGATALTSIARAGRPDVLQALLSLDVIDINVQDYHHSVIRCAVFENPFLHDRDEFLGWSEYCAKQILCTEVLLKAGADPNTRANGKFLLSEIVEKFSEKSSEFYVRHFTAVANSGRISQDHWNNLRKVCSGRVAKSEREAAFLQHVRALLEKSEGGENDGDE